MTKEYILSQWGYKQLCEECRHMVTFTPTESQYEIMVTCERDNCTHIKIR